MFLMELGTGGTVIILTRFRVRCRTIIRPRHLISRGKLCALVGENAPINLLVKHALLSLQSVYQWQASFSVVAPTIWNSLPDHRSI